MNTAKVTPESTWIELDKAMVQALDQFDSINQTINYFWRTVPDSLLLDTRAYKAFDVASASFYKAWQEFVLAHSAFLRVMQNQNDKALHVCLMQALARQETETK